MNKRPETSFILLSIRSINGQNRNISEQNGNETSLLGLGIIEKKQEGLKTFHLSSIMNIIEKIGIFIHKKGTKTLCY